MEFCPALVRFLLYTEVSVLLAGCSAISQQVLMPPIGPRPNEHIESVGGKGQLIVYSDTDEHDEDAVYYYPHSAYTIFTLDGKKVRYVRNHRDKYDEAPEVVSLEPGDYSIRARAESCGYVNVNVSVKSGQITPVYFGRGNGNSRLDANEAAVVRLPNGRLVGWAADNVGEEFPLK